MGTKRDILNMISSIQESDWQNEAKARQANLDWRKKSFRIAVRILRELRLQKESNGMTQKKLAELMGVTPQYINKVVKGQENLTLETIAKIEQALGITLIEVPSFEISPAYY
jgi:ribosome-binding protein aMBF1 (putative translation factor)